MCTWSPSRIAADPIDDVVRDATHLGSYRDIPSRDGHRLAATLNRRLMNAIAECDRAGWTQPQIVERLQPVRTLVAEAPLARRLQQWPRGYPGDFETIEYLFAAPRDSETAGDLPYWIERYALGSPIVQQHRNKVDLQARTILDTVLAKAASEPARVLIMAAGGSPDLRQIQADLEAQSFSAVLLDQDRDALAFSMERLGPIRDRLK